MRFFLLALITLFFVKEIYAVKDLPELTDAEMNAFKHEVIRHRGFLPDVGKLSFKRIRGIDFTREMLRAAEINVYRRFAQASNIIELEGVWRYYDPHWGPLDVPLNQNIFLISQAYAVTRLAKILTIEGCKPRGEGLVSWRNLIVRKLYEIADMELIEAGDPETQRKKNAFQRYAGTYIGLLLGDIGDRGLHLESEDKRPLFQESWDAFVKAEKRSTSKRLALFELYLLSVKNFIPDGYDETTIKVKIEDLKKIYGKVKESTTPRRFSFLKKPAREISEEVRNLTEAVGPGTERERHTRGALFGEDIRTKIEAALRALESEDRDEPENEESAASATASGGDNGHELREEDEFKDYNDEGGNHPLEGSLQGSARGSEEDLGSLSQMLQASHPSVPSLFSGGGASSPSRLPSYGNSPEESPSHTVSGRISLAGYLRGVRKELPPRLLGAQAVAAALPMEEIGDRTVHDPLATSINLSSSFTLGESSEERSQNPSSIEKAKGSAVPPGLRLDFSSPTTLRPMEQYDDDTSVPEAVARAQGPRERDSQGTSAADAAQARSHDLEKYEEDSDSESEFSDSDENSSKEDSEGDEEEGDRGNTSPYKKMRSSLSNKEIQEYMEENSESLRKELLELEGASDLLLIQHIEKVSKQRFSTLSEARKILEEFLDRDKMVDSALAFNKCLSQENKRLAEEIRLWIMQARSEESELSTRDIAERIVSTKGLNIRIFPQQIKKLLRFFQEHQIRADRKEQTILDVLNAQEEETLNHVFIHFSAEFDQRLKSREVRKRDFIPLLKMKLEEFSKKQSGKEFCFQSERSARGYIMGSLQTFGLELPGKHAKTFVSKFLRDERNIDFIREKILEIAPLWDSTLDKGSLVKKFENDATRHAKVKCEFNTVKVGVARLRTLIRRHVIKDGETYRLNSLVRKEKRKA